MGLACEEWVLDIGIGSDMYKLGLAWRVGSLIFSWC